MKPLLYLLIFTLIFCVANGWWDTVYDTVDVKYEDGTQKEYYTRAWFQGNEKILQPNGRYESFYNNGRLKEQGTYDWNEKLGCWIEWYENGDRKREMNYSKGKLHGSYIEFHPDHSVKLSAYYKYGMKHGLWTHNKPGHDIQHTFDNYIDINLYYFDTLLVTIIDNGQFIKHCGHDSLYFLIDNRFFYNNTISKWIEWHRNRKAFSFGSKVDNLKDGKWLTLDNLGEIKKINIYKNGELIYNE